MEARPIRDRAGQDPIVARQSGHLDFFNSLLSYIFLRRASSNKVTHLPQVGQQSAPSRAEHVPMGFRLPAGDELHEACIRN